MNQNQVFNCTGFNFHNPEPPRGYVIFDPKTQEESDRLNTMLGATALWQKVGKKYQKQLGRSAPSGKGAVVAFTEMFPVGWADNDDVIAVVVAGAAGYGTDGVHINGQWFAIRFPGNAEAEVKADLQANLELRRNSLETEIGKARANPEDRP